MKLALIFRRFAPDGGAERTVENMLTASQAVGIHITVISESVRAARVAPTRLLPLPQSSGSRTRRFTAFQSAVANTLNKHNGEFDLIQTHEKIFGAHLYRAGDGIHAAWLHRLKQQRPWWRQKLMALDSFHQHHIRSEQKIAKESDTIFVANSPMVADEMKAWLDLPTSRIRTIENGVDLNHFRPPTAQQRAAARATYHLTADEQVIAYIGSGFERKGAFELVRALATPSLRDAKILIAGRDKRIGKLTALAQKSNIADRVQILGSIKNVLPVLHCADIFALPTLYDPGANAVLEAIACGLPVVTTAANGYGNIAAAHNAGKLCDRHPDSISESVAEIFTHHNTHAAAARQLRHHFNLTATTKKWLTLYKEIMS